MVFNLVPEIEDRVVSRLEEGTAEDLFVGDGGGASSNLLEDVDPIKTDGLPFIMGDWIPQYLVQKAFVFGVV